MKYTGPRNRLARREGMDLGLKTPGSKSHARLLKKLTVPPGQHPVRKRRKISEHAHQLREKQKLRTMFGLSESQLKKYFDIASQKKGNTAFYLAQFLERRLDNAVYRLGFSPTRASARQLVNHGHILVNNKRMTIPSYVVKAGDTVALSDKTVKIPYIAKVLDDTEAPVPSWFERKAIVGKLIADPGFDLIGKQINLRLVIEFYSR